jgi:site-specific DNA recombinase
MKDVILQSSKLIATYYRVSTSTQEDNQTIQTQISAVKDFAVKNGYKIVQEYADDGWSGDSLARPSLDQLRVDARKKMWEAVLIYDPDRLARRYSYQELVRDELVEAGIEVIYVTTPAPKNDEDRILHGVKGLFAQYERAKISERFRLGKLRKVKEGHILTTEAKYGWRYIPNKKEIGKQMVHGYYEINDDEAKVVRMIWSWIDKEGLTLRAVVKRLFELKIRPRESKKGTWSTSTLSTMLKHRAYIGEAHWGSSYAVVPENPVNTEKYKKQKKSSRRKRPEEEWYIIPVPPIIEREQFFRVRARLEANFAMSQRNKKNDYLLSGKIWCVCGRRRCGCSPLGGKHLYYRCNDRIQSFPLPHTCKEKGLNARVADEMVWGKVSSLMSSPDLMMKQIERWQKSQKSKPQSSQVNMQELGKDIGKLKDQEERYNKAYGAGLITINQLREYTVPVRERITAIESQIIKSEQEVSQINAMGTPHKKEVKAFAKESMKVLGDLNFGLKREIVMSTIDKVIGTQEKLQVYGYIPVTNVSFCSIHRHCWVTKCG